MCCETVHGTKFSLPLERKVKYDYESAGHRAVMVLSIVGVAFFVVLAIIGALS
jgi:hypothetical protein